MLDIASVHPLLGAIVWRDIKENVHRYDVQYLDSSHPRGNLCMVYYPLESETEEYISRAAGLEGLVGTDKIVWLDQFFPHGKEKDGRLAEIEEKYMRKGAGSYLMDLALQEAIRNGAKFIWAHVEFENKYMPGFLEKHGFHKINDAPTKVYCRAL